LAQTILRTKVKGIHNCSNEGQLPSPRGDNSKRLKIIDTEISIKKEPKKLFSKTSRPISIHLRTNHS
jgi:hypothetical protein